MKPTEPFCRLALFLTAQLLASNAMAADAGKPSLPEQAQESAYRPQKVVYDVAVAGRAALVERLDRVSYLNNMYQADPFDASIVLVMHGDELAFLPHGITKNTALS